MRINYTCICILICLYIISILFILCTSKTKNTRNIYESFENNESSHIPKIIHMTCKDKNNISDFYKSNYNSWKKYHTNWDIRLYDDNDLINFCKTNYPSIYTDIMQTYDKIIFKIDIFKMLVLDKIGGVYVDMDVECLKSIDDLVSNDNYNVILGYGPFEHNSKYDVSLIECAIMISKPNHPFWNKYVIPSLKPKHKHTKIHPVICTGPLFITHNVNEYNKSYDDLKIMDPVYFYPINNQTNSVSQTLIKNTQDMIKNHSYPKESYCVHHFDGSWWKKTTRKGHYN